MKKSALAILLSLLASTAAATPVTCGVQPDWSDYFFAYPSGCEVGDKLIAAFSSSSSVTSSIGTLIRFPTPLSSPDSAGFEFSLLNSGLFGSPFFAGSSQTTTFGIAFRATVEPGGGLITGDLFSLLGMQVTGTGAIAASQVACFGGTFTRPIPVSPVCSSGLTALASLSSPQDSAMASFSPVDSIDLSLLVTLSGGSNGSASLTGVRMLAAEAVPVPEPSSLVLLGSTVAMLTRTLRPRRLR